MLLGHCACGLFAIIFSAFGAARGRDGVALVWYLIAPLVSLSELESSVVNASMVGPIPFGLEFRCSHSLAGAAALAAAFAALTWAAAVRPRGAGVPGWTLAALVLSHWAADVLMHGTVADGVTLDWRSDAHADTRAGPVRQHGRHAGPVGCGCRRSRPALAAAFVVTHVAPAAVYASLPPGLLYPGNAALYELVAWWVSEGAALDNGGQQRAERH